MIRFDATLYGKMPAGIAGLPRTADGWPIPFFVATPRPGQALDLRLTSFDKPRLCHARKLCWICGEPLQDVVALVGGPQSVQHATYSDAPSHPDCAHYAAVACPILNGTYKRRTSDGLPGVVKPAGSIDELPAKVAVYCCRSYRVLLAPEDGVTIIFRPGKCCGITWYQGGKLLEK